MTKRNADISRVEIPYGYELNFNHERQFKAYIIDKLRGAGIPVGLLSGDVTRGTLKESKDDCNACYVFIWSE
jgi:hypothetical protein